MFDIAFSLQTGTNICLIFISYYNVVDLPNMFNILCLWFIFISSIETYFFWCHPWIVCARPNSGINGCWGDAW